MPLTNYPNGFANGVSIRGMPILSSYSGNILWVSSTQSNASNANPGTFVQPFSTILGAIAQATAANGDIIVCKAGHAETITTAAGLVISKSSVAIVGLGTGSARPTLTFGTNTTANIPVTAANCSIVNVLFVANVLDVASVFTATSTNTPTDFAVQNCEFRDSASNKNFISIITGNATANSMDGLTFNGNRISSLATTAATTAVKFSSATDRVQMLDNYGNWAILNNTAALLATGANNVTNFDFGRNVINRPNTATTSGLAISTSGTAWTGQCYDNRIWGLDGSAQIWINTSTGLAFNQNFCPITGAADTSGLINPAAA